MATAHWKNSPGMDGGRWILMGVLGVCSLVAAQENPALDPALRQYNSAAGLLQRGLYDLAEGEYRRFLAAHASHEKATLAHYGLAVSLYRQQKLEDAVAELRALGDDHRFEFAADVQAMLAQAHLTLGRPGEALDACNAFLKRHGAHELGPDVSAARIEALQRLDKPEDVIREAKAFSERLPESPLRERTDYFLGLALTAKGEHAQAARTLDACLERFANGDLSAQILLLSAQAHHRAGDAEGAAKLYERLLGGASGELTGEAQLGLARAFQQLGRLDEAASKLDALLSGQADAKIAAAARVCRGLVRLDQGQFDLALADLERVSAEDADWGDDAAYWSAKCRLRSGDYPDAARRLEKALSAYPKSTLRAEMEYDLAVALVQAGRREEALPVLEQFRRGFAEHPMRPDAEHLLAVVLHQLGRFDDSQKVCAEFLKRYPEHASAPSAAFVRAENEFLAGKLDAAEKAYRQFLDRYPKDMQTAQARYRLGMTLYRLQRFDEAAPLLAESVPKAAGDGAARGFEGSLLALGDLAFQRGEWKTAEQHFADYLQRGADPLGREDALLKLGLSLQRQDRNEEALRAFDELLSKFDRGRHALHARFERGQCLAALNRPTEAEEALRLVASEGGEDPLVGYALQHLGVLASQRGDAQEAASLFQRAAGSTKEAPLKASAMFQEGQAFFAAGQYEPALAALSRFLKQFADHERAAMAAAQRAMALARLNRGQEALNALDAVLEKHGAKLDATTRQSLLYDRAWSLRGEGRTDEAKAAYERLLEESAKVPGRLAAHALLECGELEAEGKAWDRAVERLRRLTALAESDASLVPDEVLEPGLYRLGVCEYQLEQYVEAAKTLERFVARFTASRLLPSALFFGGDACLRAGRPEAAVPLLARLVETAPKDDAAAPALLRLGESLAALQRWGKSEQAFMDYLDRYKDGAQRYQALFGAGWARENQGRHEEAIQAYREMLVMHQGQTAARAQFQIGECLFAQGKFEEAVREFLNVDILYAVPEWSAAALYEAGQCFEKLGKAQEARNQFKTVVERFGESKWAKLASRRLADGNGRVASGREE